MRDWRAGGARGNERGMGEVRARREVERGEKRGPEPAGGARRGGQASRPAPWPLALF